ncbi:MAG TPA: glycerophosphodiester phosphodiesterase family protein, partial [Frankiaceae bacterium]|nr:glycerophosphodiester phosphodiesterase family protein [Frankiaceae bacterium]
MVLALRRSSARRHWLADLPVAHRGLHDQMHPENSLGAFEQACAQGYAIELDVVLTGDGVPVVIHDANTARLTSVNLDVASTSLEDLQQLRLLGTDESIPTMEAVTRLVAGRTPILVELKTGPSAGAVGPPVVEALRRFGVTHALMSFDPRMLGWARRHAPQSPRVQLSGALRGEPLPLIAKLLVRSMVTNVVTWPQAIAYDVFSAPSLGL